MNWLLNRLKEKSTYAGIFVLLSIFAGYSVPEDWKPLIIQIGTGIGALAAIIIQEKTKPAVIKNEPVADTQTIVTPELSAEQLRNQSNS